MYIAIEGIKGTGKSTLLTALTPHLHTYCDAKKQSVALFYPTKPIPEDHHLERCFDKSQSDDTYLRALYAARSNYHASRVDWNADLIISDRSILTSLAVRWENAFQANFSPRQHYEQVRSQEYEIAIPDIIIQLDTCNDILLQRYAKRARQYGQQEETLDSILNMKNSYKQLLQWLNAKQARELIGKSISVYKFNTSTSSIESICQQSLSLIQQNFANINSEFFLKNPYSPIY